MFNIFGMNNTLIHFSKFKLVKKLKLESISNQERIIDIEIDFLKLLLKAFKNIWVIIYLKSSETGI